MKRSPLPFSLAVVLVAATASAQTPRRFTGGPVTLADQGSFFIGGVTKITEHAAIPGAPPGQPAPRADAAADHDRPDVRAVPDPARRSGAGLAGDHGARLHAHRRGARIDARRSRGLVSLLRPQGRRHLRRRSVRARAAPGSTSPCCTRRARRRWRGDAKGAAELMPNFGRISDNGAWTAWFGHLLPAGSTIADRHADPARRPRRSAAGHRDGAARRAALPARRGRRVLQAARAERRGDAARIDLRHLHAAGARRRPTPGRRRIWRCSSSVSAARSSRRIRSRASWATTWCASSRSAARSIWSRG